MYADDRKLYTEIRTEADCKLLQTDLDNILTWGRLNHLNLNKQKCYVMTHDIHKTD
mgnify:CR=1 FL=1